MKVISYKQPKIIIGTIWILLIAIAAGSNCFAQNVQLGQVNSQLRKLFSALHKPSNSAPFLYEMSVKTTDTAYWTCLGSTSLDEDTWLDLYSEMYHSAYDTTDFLAPDSLYPRFLRNEKEVIPIYLMNYEFNYLKKEALATSEYFEFDTIDSCLKDKRYRESPYLKGRIFATSTFDTYYAYSDPIFRIDPSLIFSDSSSHKYFLQSYGYSLQINFDDGNGFITINPNYLNNHNVLYPSAGDKNIEVRILDIKSQVICYSRSLLHINSDKRRPVPSYTYDFPGINAALFSPCDGDPLQSGKLVIYLSGWDAMDMPVTNSKYGRDVFDIYSEMIGNRDLAQLRNRGYGFLVVDWKNSRTDIRFNALYLVNLIERLKCELKFNAEQYVVVGESMGGLVARFALSYMENNQYRSGDLSPFFIQSYQPSNKKYLEEHPELLNINNTWKSCRKLKAHNTRLLITIDTPNQGASIPLSLQLLYRNIEGVLKSLPLFNQAMWISKQNNVALDGMAAKQMLYYHIDYKSGLSYTSAPEKALFFNQLNSMGNYPQKLKTLALSNGALNGGAQKNPVSLNSRSPGDLILGIHLNQSLRILGIQVPFSKISVDFFSNPNGIGDIVSLDLGFYKIVPKLFLFGVDFKFTYVPLISNHTVQANLLALCTSPGGYIDLADYSNGWKNLSTHSWFYSDGTRFCFVPVQSALDYGILGHIPALNADIENTNISNKLLLSPYDVMIAYPSLSNDDNHAHIGYRNPVIYNLSSNNPSASLFQSTYVTCEKDDQVIRSLLSLEIGDEELFLENAVLSWDASYQAEFDIHLNEPNKYYEYSNLQASNFLIPGCYSKSSPFLIDTLSTATFYVNSQNAFTGLGLSFSPPFTGSFMKVDSIFSVCCNNFKEERRRQNYYTKNGEGNELIIIPNPLIGNKIKLQLMPDLFLEDNFQLRMENIHGMILKREILHSEAFRKGNYELDISDLNLKTGLYFIQLIGNKSSYTSKFIRNEN